MKGQHALFAVLGVAGAVLAIERFYEHPTYGRGLSAFLAMVQAGIGLE